MPKLPNPDELTRRAPQPSNVISVPRVQKVDPMAGALAERGAALSKLGTAVGGLGEDIGDIYYAEKVKLDDLKVSDAVNQLKNSFIDNAKGEGGFESVRGSGVLQPDFMNSYEGKAQSRIDELAKSLSNEEQRNEFLKRASTLKLGQKVDLLNHVTNESKNYENDVFTSTLATSLREAESNPFDPARRQAAIDSGTLQITKYALHNGMPDEWLKAKNTEFLSGVHSTVVAQAMNAENYEFASDYLQKNKETIDPAKYIDLDTKLKGRVKAVEAVSSANEYANIAPTSTISAAREHFTKKFSDPSQAKDAFSEWSAIQKAKEADREATQLAIKQDLTDKMVKGTLSITDIAESGIEDPEAWKKKLNSWKDKGDFTTDEVKLADIRRRININPASVKEDEIWDGALKSWSGEDAQKLADKQRTLLDKGLKKDDQLKRAHKYLDHARTKKMFDQDFGENETGWAVASEQLDAWRENNPDGDPIEFANKLLEPAKVDLVERLLDMIPFVGMGMDPTKEAESRKQAEIETAIGAPKKDFNDWLSKAQKSNPDASVEELTDYYNKKYGAK